MSASASDKWKVEKMEGVDDSDARYSQHVNNLFTWIDVRCGVVEPLFKNEENREKALTRSAVSKQETITGYLHSDGAITQ